MQMVLRSFTSVLLSTLCAELIGCPLAILQSSLPSWLFEHSGPMTLCACLGVLTWPGCPTCVW